MNVTAPCWEVQIVNPADGRPKRWDVYPSRERAESVAATLRKHKFWVQVRRVAGPNELALEGGAT